MTTVKNKLEAIVYMVENSGIDHKTLAEKAGVHRAQIHRWLTDGVGIPHSNSLTKISNALGYTIHHEANKIEITKQQKETENMQHNYPQQLKVATALVDLQSEKILRLENQLSSKSVATVEGIEYESFNHIASQLEISAKRYQWIFLNTDMPMSCSRDGVLRDVNPALTNLIGWKTAQIAGKHILDLIHIDDQHRVAKELEKDSRNIDVRILKANKKYCLAQIEAQTFGDPRHNYSLAMIKCIDPECKDL